MDVKEQVEIWRAKARAGELTQDEMREALKLMNGGLVMAASTSAKSKAKKAPVNSDDLLSELDGLM